MTEKRDKAIAFMRDAQRQWDERQSRDPPLTDDDIREITAAIGDDAPFPEFRALADAEKHSLFRRVLRCRRVAEQFDLADEMIAEDPAPLMSALKRIAAVIPKSPALLTAIAIETSETRGTGFEEEFVKMIELADKAESMLDAAQRVSTKPRHFNRRRMKTLKKGLVAFLLRVALTSEGIPVPLTGSNKDHNRPPNPYLTLTERLVAFASPADRPPSNKKEKGVEGDAIRKRLYQYSRSRRGREQTKKKVF